MTLPPGVENRGGRLVRVLIKTAADGSEREQVRPVSLDWEEAKAQHMDYHHPQLGWLLWGKKLVTDRSVGSRMMDNSTAVAVHEEDRPRAVTPQTESEE